MGLFLNKKKEHDDPSKTLYVLSVIYNPYGYESRYKLYWAFKEWIEREKNVKFLTIEIAHGHSPYVVTDPCDKWNLQLRSHHALWHKEAGLNVGFSYLFNELAPDAKYVAWLDADIMMINPHWVKDTIHALGTYKIIQPFSQAHNLNSKYESMWKCDSALYRYVTRKGYNQNPPIDIKYLAGGHPGLAWAARAQVIKDLCGLLDFCVAGSGDTHMLNAFMGEPLLFMSPGMPEPFRQGLRDWGANADQVVQKNIGYIRGACVHYHHGKSAKRGYDKRWDIMAFHQYDQNTDIIMEDNGLYSFAGNKPQLEEDLKRSGMERDEDDNSYEAPFA